MSGKDNGVKRHLVLKRFQAAYYILETAKLEVCPSDAHPEEGVATERHAFLLAIEEHGAGSVAGSGNDGKAMVAEFNHVVIGEILAHGRHLISQ